MSTATQAPPVTDRFTGWSKQQLTDFIRERGGSPKSGMTRDELADHCRWMVFTRPGPARRKQDIDGAIASLRGTSQYYTYDHALTVLAEEARKCAEFAEALELAKYYLPERLR
jgi:hypothetical protein